MSSGRVCVSVCAETVDDMIMDIRLAEEVADIVEVRLDCLSGDEFDLTSGEAVKKPLLRILAAKTGVPWITTLRTKVQGGHRTLSDDERRVFYGAGFETEFGDFEEDVIGDAMTRPSHTRICSFHDLEGVPSDLDGIFKRLACTGADIVKIAVTADDITDAIPVWNLLKTASQMGKPLIPIAMGEAGKWTHILGPRTVPR